MNKGKKIIVSLLCLLFISVFVTQVVVPEPGIISSAEAATSVRLSMKRIKLTVGEKYKLVLIGNKEKVTWSSSNKKIATVNKNGYVKAKKPGKVTITAQVGNKQYKCKVTVKAKTPKPTAEPTPEPTPVPTPVLSADRQSVQLRVGESTTVYITSSNGSTAATVTSQTGNTLIATSSE